MLPRHGSFENSAARWTAVERADVEFLRSPSTNDLTSPTVNGATLATGGEIVYNAGPNGRGGLRRTTLPRIDLGELQPLNLHVKGHYILARRKHAFAPVQTARWYVPAGKFEVTQDLVCAFCDDHELRCRAHPPSVSRMTAAALLVRRFIQKRDRVRAALALLAGALRTIRPALFAFALRRRHRIDRLVADWEAEEEAVKAKERAAIATRLLSITKNSAVAVTTQLKRRKSRVSAEEAGVYSRENVAIADKRAAICVVLRRSFEEFHAAMAEWRFEYQDKADAVRALALSSLGSILSVPELCHRAGVPRQPDYANLATLRAAQRECTAMLARRRNDMAESVRQDVDSSVAEITMSIVMDCSLRRPPTAPRRPHRASGSDDELAVPSPTAPVPSEPVKRGSAVESEGSVKSGTRSTALAGSGRWATTAATAAAENSSNSEAEDDEEDEGSERGNGHEGAEHGGDGGRANSDSRAAEQRDEPVDESMEEDGTNVFVPVSPPNRASLVTNDASGSLETALVNSASPICPLEANPASAGLVAFRIGATPPDGVFDVSVSPNTTSAPLHIPRKPRQLSVFEHVAQDGSASLGPGSGASPDFSSTSIRTPGMTRKRVSIVLTPRAGAVLPPGRSPRVSQVDPGSLSLSGAVRSAASASSPLGHPLDSTQQPSVARDTANGRSGDAADDFACSSSFVTAVPLADRRALSSSTHLAGNGRSPFAGATPLSGVSLGIAPLQPGQSPFAPSVSVDGGRDGHSPHAQPSSARKNSSRRRRSSNRTPSSSRWLRHCQRATPFVPSAALREPFPFPPLPPEAQHRWQNSSERVPASAVRVKLRELRAVPDTELRDRIRALPYGIPSLGLLFPMPGGTDDGNTSPADAATARLYTLPSTSLLFGYPVNPAVVATARSLANPPPPSLLSASARGAEKDLLAMPPSSLSAAALAAVGRAGALASGSQRELFSPPQPTQHVEAWQASPPRRGGHVAVPRASRLPTVFPPLLSPDIRGSKLDTNQRPR